MKRLHKIQRYRTIYSVMPGQYRVSDGSSVIRTYAGSTLAVCLFDSGLGIGGIANFIVPGKLDGLSIVESRIAEFGIAYIEYIVADVVKRGGSRKSLKAKLFGLSTCGGNTMSYAHATKTFIEEYVRRETIPVTGSHLENSQCMEIIMFPEKGSVYVRSINDTHIVAEVLRVENEYITSELSATENQTTCHLF